MESCASFCFDGRNLAEFMRWRGDAASCCVDGCVLIKSMRSRRTERPSVGLSPAAGLLLLSALWAVASLRTDLIPQFGAETLSTAQVQAALFSVFAAVAASIAVAQHVEFPRGRHAWACAGIGVGLFVVPAGLTACAQGWVSKLERVAVFSLTPVLAVVLEPYLHDSATRQGKAALAGTLAAVVGVLCLFPLDIPGSFRAGVALCALLAAAVRIAASNCLAVRLAHDLAGRSTLSMAAQAGAAPVPSALSWPLPSRPHIEWRWSALPTQLLGLFVIELPALFLLFWLMRRLAASRMTARFLLAPLFAILAGMALEPTSAARARLARPGPPGGRCRMARLRPCGNNRSEQLEPLNAFTTNSPRQPPLCE